MPSENIPDEIVVDLTGTDMIKYKNFISKTSSNVAPTIMTVISLLQQ